MNTRKKSHAIKILEKHAGGPLTVGGILEAYRLGEEIPQTTLAKTLGISRAHLCDIEKGRRRVSIERAIIFAKLLGKSPSQFVRLTIQELLDDVNSNLKFEVKSA